MIAAWHVYPLGFVGAPIRGGYGFDPQSRFEHLTRWLGYVVDLGCDALSLGPVFRSVSHGYDTLDYFSIDPRLGTAADFDQFLAAAHDHGLKVLLDGVFNHVASEHPLYRAAQAGDAEARRCFIWKDGYAEAFEGNLDLIKLNHAEPKVAEMVASVLYHWLDRGVDGFRMDAAYAVGPDFFAGILPGIRESFPQAYFFGEVIHGDYADFVARSTLDAVTEYELWKSCWSAIDAKNFFELSWTLSRMNALVDSYAPVTFIGNHDTSRIATLVGAERVPLALAVLLSIGGFPQIYYGDEQGFVGVKEQRRGGDDAVRPPFPDSVQNLWGFGWWLFDVHKALLAVRRDRPWLARAHVTNIELATHTYHYRVEAEGQYLEVHLDVDQPSVVLTDANGTVFRYGL
ncbi:MAG: alpha-amylase [Propionibacteriaceae bacterium]|jgi:glycosidase|nr:alpha-amylase [Propionibacteriaceae bacterium]